MDDLLKTSKLDHLSDALSALTIEECFTLLDQGRPKLLEKLKEVGVSKLPERQAFAKAVANGKREILGSGNPILVCMYSAGVTPAYGRELMQPLLDACKGAGLKDQFVLDHHNEPPYNTCATSAEYIQALYDKVISSDPEQLKSRPWVLVAHSHGSVACYGLACKLGPKCRGLVVMCRRAPTMELLNEIFGVPEGEGIAAMEAPRLGQILGTAYANPALIAMTASTNLDNWTDSAKVTVKIARDQYSSPCSLCAQKDIDAVFGSGPLPSSVVISAPILAIASGKETEQGETAAKAEKWQELTSGAFKLEVINEDHMRVPLSGAAISLAVEALKPHVVVS